MRRHREIGRGVARPWCPACCRALADSWVLLDLRDELVRWRCRCGAELWWAVLGGWVLHRWREAESGYGLNP